jgi:hypothetical protein
MSKLERYFHEKSLMMSHHAFAVRNESLENSIWHLLNYQYHKDFAQKEYFEMMHNEREVLHTLMIL